MRLWWGEVCVLELMYSRQDSILRGSLGAIMSIQY